MWNSESFYTTAYQKLKDVLMVTENGIHISHEMQDKHGY